MNGTRKPYVRETFDREEKLYFLKVALLIILVYFFQEAISQFIAIIALALPLLILLYLYAKSINTGETFGNLLREQITLVPVPYAEAGKKRFMPWAAITLIAINVVIFYVTHSLPASTLEFIEKSYMFLPIYRTTWNLLLSPLLCMFLHANAGHLWGNMIYLWAFAPAVEEKLGAKRLVFFYLLTGLMGSLTSLAIVRLFFSETLHGMGASGAVCGIMGVFMVRCYFKKLVIPIPLFAFVNFKLKVNSLLPLGLFFLRDLSGGISQLTGSRSAIGYWAHIGSLLIGVLLAMLFKLQRAAVEDKYTEAGLAAIDNQHFRRKSNESLRKALELNPGNQAALLGLAREYAVTRKAEGRELFARAIAMMMRSSPEQAAAVYKEYIGAYNRMLEPDLQYRLAGILYRQHDLEPALRALEMVILEPAANDQTRQNAFSHLIAMLAENNMFEAAQFRLGQFKELFPESALLKVTKDKLAGRLKR